MRIFFVLALSMAASVLAGQSYSVFGKVVAKGEADFPLESAHVQLLHLPDSAVKRTTTNEEGVFFLREMTTGTYSLQVTYIGFGIYERQIEIVDQAINVGTIELEESAVALGEVEVKDIAIRGQLKGDTTQYNASAYKTNPDASTEDLIQKMPGITVRDGQVQAQGETVQKVLVDGREFFGNDAQATLKNLPADVVQKIEVFDKQSEQSEFTGFNDGNTEKTINIVTNINTATARFGNLYAGYGTDDKYRAGLNINLFNDDQRWTILAQTNNVNQQNFAAEDLLGVVSSRGRGGRGGGRGSGGRGGWGRGGVSDFLVGDQPGISQTHALGLNFSDEWGDKVEVQASYFFNYTDNNSSSLVDRTFVGRNLGQTYFEDTQGSSENINHRFSSRIQYQMSEKTSFIIRPRLTVQQNDGIENTFATNLFSADPLNESTYSNSSDLTAIDFSNSILWRQQFNKTGRTISINLSTGYSENVGESFLNSENIYYESGIPNSLTRQFADLVSDGWSLSTRTQYTEPLGEKGQLSFTYNFSYRTDDSDKQTYDYSDDTEDFDFFNTDLSNVFTNDYTTHRIGTGVRLRGEKSFFITDFSVEFSQLNNDQSFPAMAHLTKNYTNIIPFLMWRLNITREKNLRVFYRARTESPSISQLQNVINNSNPLAISTGNPDLEQSYGHSVFVRYSATNTEKATVFYAFLSGGLTSNYITNKTTFVTEDTEIADNLILPAGGQITSPVNLDGYWNTRLFLTYGLPVSWLKSNLNFNFSTSYTVTPGYVNDLENEAANTSVGLGVVISSNISEKVDFTLSSQSNLSNVENTLNSDLDTRYFNQASDAKISLLFGNRIKLETNVTHQYYDGLSEDLDQDYWLWSASLGVKMLKDNLGELKLSMIDILRQNNSLVRNVTSAYFEDVQTAVLQRYVMLSFAYRLRAFGTPPEEEPRRFPGQWRRDD